MQGVNCIAIGTKAGSTGQTSQSSIAIGDGAGLSQKDFAIAIGQGAADSQGQEAIAIGRQAASAGQGNFSVTIGGQADINNNTAYDKCLMFNTTGTAVKHTAPNEWKVATKALDPANPANGGLIANTANPAATIKKPTGTFTHYLVYSPSTGEIQMCPV